MKSGIDFPIITDKNKFDLNKRSTDCLLVHSYICFLMSWAAMSDLQQTLPSPIASVNVYG